MEGKMASNLKVTVSLDEALVRELVCASRQGGSRVASYVR